MQVTNLLKSHAVSQTRGARDRTFRLPLVEQANRRRSFLPPDLQPRRIFDTHTSPRRARLNYGRDADTVKPPERFLPGWEAALGSHPGPGGQRAGAALLTPAEMRLAPRWAISGPGVDGGWARLGSMGEPGRSHLPLPPTPASPEPTLISTGVGGVVGIHGRPVGAAEGTRGAGIRAPPWAPQRKDRTAGPSAKRRMQVVP